MSLHVLGGGSEVEREGGVAARILPTQAGKVEGDEAVCGVERARRGDGEGGRLISRCCLECLIGAREHPAKATASEHDTVHPPSGHPRALKHPSSPAMLRIPATSPQFPQAPAPRSGLHAGGWTHSWSTTPFTSAYSTWRRAKVVRMPCGGRVSKAATRGEPRSKRVTSALSMVAGAGGVEPRERSVCIGRARDGRGAEGRDARRLARIQSRRRCARSSSASWTYPTAHRSSSDPPLGWTSVRDACTLYDDAYQLPPRTDSVRTWTRIRGVH